jgi:hypothetical protein
MQLSGYGRALAGASVLALAVLAIGGAPPAQANSLALRATYAVDAHLDFKRATIAVDTRARVTNPTSKPVSELSFNLASLRVAQVTVAEVSVSGKALAYHLDDQTIVARLPAPLATGASTTVRIRHRAKLATNLADKGWYLSKSAGIVTGYRWIPWLSRAARFDRPNIGTPLVTGVSPQVDVRFSTDVALKFATSGRRTGGSALAHTFTARDVRDFNFAASPSYRSTTERIDGIEVTILTVNLSPAKIFKTARRALPHYRQRLGAYPYPQLMIAETPGYSSMESPAMFWLGQQRRGTLAYLVAHEIAHQWFYGVVGSDQADEPFADEGPVELLTRDLLGTRRASRCAIRRLDQQVYAYEKECYYEVIYVQGDNYLADYRSRVGQTSFWAGMRDYYRSYRFRIGGTRQLLDALDAAAAGRGGGHKSRFPRYY